MATAIPAIPVTLPMFGINIVMWGSELLNLNIDQAILQLSILRRQHTQKSDNSEVRPA